MRLLVALIVWVAAAIGAVAVGSAVETGVGTNSTSAGTSSGGVSSSGSSGTFDASAVGAADPESLFHTASLNKALNTARAQLGATARLGNVALYPGYLSLIAAKGAGEVDFYVDAQGTSHTVSIGGSPEASTLFSLGRVDAAAPEALSRRIARLAHLPQSKLHYMVLGLDSSTGQLRWLVYPVQGATRIEYFEAGGARAPIREQLP